MNSAKNNCAVTQCSQNMGTLLHIEIHQDFMFYVCYRYHMTLNYLDISSFFYGASQVLL